MHINSCEFVVRRCCQKRTTLVQVCVCVFVCVLVSHPFSPQFVLSLQLCCCTMDAVVGRSDHAIRIYCNEQQHQTWHQLTCAQLCVDQPEIERNTCCELPAEELKERWKNKNCIHSFIGWLLCILCDQRSTKSEKQIKSKMRDKCVWERERDKKTEQEMGNKNVRPTLEALYPIWSSVCGKAKKKKYI